MRRVDLIAGTREIVNAIETSNVEETLQQLRRAPRGTQIPPAIYAAVFDSLREYSIKAHGFSPAATQIASILRLTKLQNPRIWTQLMSEERTAVAYNLSTTIEFAKEYLPKIAELSEQESLKTIQSGEGDSKFEGKSIMSVLIIEESNRYSSPERIIEILESVDTLYRMCSTMNGIPPEGLSVIACDSGSDKSFDFLGLAKVIECVKELILSMWDRVVFYKERQLSERIGLVSQTLPIFSDLEKLAESKALAPEQVELVRRGLLSGISKFMESGATIPEIENFTHYNPRKLMAPEPKLLVSAPEGAEGEATTAYEAAQVEEENRGTLDQSGELDFAQLGDNDRDALIRLLEKARKTNTANSSDSATSEESEEALGES